MQQLNNTLESTQKQLDETTKELHLLKSRFLPSTSPALGSQFDPHGHRQLNCDGTFTGHLGVIWALTTSEEGWLISGSSDSTIRVWDLTSANPKCKRVVPGHEGVVHAVVIAKGNRLCSGSSDRSIRVIVFLCLVVS